MRQVLGLAILAVFFSPFFQLHAQAVKPKPAIGVSVGIESGLIELSVVGNRVIYNNAPLGKKIEIFSVIGLKIGDIEIKTAQGEYLLNVPRGYYILKIDDTVRKVAVK
ncbi:hypothetical protein AwDysgo_08480 [Bacteroidales bacterium]|nr:hypothetical protein AwDysgo_08480 [Bacteroidales bacterium]